MLLSRLYRSGYGIFNKESWLGNSDSYPNCVRNRTVESESKGHQFQRDRVWPVVEPLTDSPDDNRSTFYNELVWLFEECMQVVL
jgi:hypothetical protein